MFTYRNDNVVETVKEGSELAEEPRTDGLEMQTINRSQSKAPQRAQTVLRKSQRESKGSQRTPYGKSSRRRAGKNAPSKGAQLISPRLNRTVKTSSKKTPLVNARIGSRASRRGTC